ncbi:hypothetical protein HK102_004857 [Quaeritorhiza haematococci]|nr:hypothetical protein HK102_004857 [Quaeritorhiza haematococci]
MGGGNSKQRHQQKLLNEALAAFSESEQRSLQKTWNFLATNTSNAATLARPQSLASARHHDHPTASFPAEVLMITLLPRELGLALSALLQDTAREMYQQHPPQSRRNSISGTPTTTTTPHIDLAVWVTVARYLTKGSLTDRQQFVAAFNKAVPAPADTSTASPPPRSSTSSRSPSSQQNHQLRHFLEIFATTISLLPGFTRRGLPSVGSIHVAASGDTHPRRPSPTVLAPLSPGSDNPPKAPGTNTPTLVVPPPSPLALHLPLSRAASSIPSTNEAATGATLPPPSTAGLAGISRFVDFLESICIRAVTSSQNANLFDEDTENQKEGASTSTVDLSTDFSTWYPPHTPLQRLWQNIFEHLFMVPGAAHWTATDKAAAVGALGGGNSGSRRASLNSTRSFSGMFVPAPDNSFVPTHRVPWLVGGRSECLDPESLFVLDSVMDPRFRGEGLAQQQQRQQQQAQAHGQQEGGGTGAPTVPPRAWKQLFSTTTHGKSWTVFQNRIVEANAVLIVIRDSDGFVFGAFNAPALELSPKLDYFGLWLDANFETGHSKANPVSTTYSNTRLSNKEEFKIQYVEAWCIEEKQIDEDSEPGGKTKMSILDGNTDASALLEMGGRRMYSKEVREPNLDVRDEDEGGDKGEGV